LLQNYTIRVIYCSETNLSPISNRLHQKCGPKKSTSFREFFTKLFSISPFDPQYRFRDPKDGACLRNRILKKTRLPGGFSKLRKKSKKSTFFEIFSY
jgi:hypothetical protein